MDRQQQWEKNLLRQKTQKKRKREIENGSMEGSALKAGDHFTLEYCPLLPVKGALVRKNTPPAIIGGKAWRQKKPSWLLTTIQILLPSSRPSWRVKDTVWGARIAVRNCSLIWKTRSPILSFWIS